MHLSQRTWPAIASAIWAILFGGLNLYWTFGGRWLTSRLGESLQESIAENDRQLMIANTIGGLGKLGLGALAITTILPVAVKIPTRVLSLLLITPGILMLLYGFANWSIVTASMLGLIDTPSSIGEASLVWYFWLWEPLWMIGGMLMLATWWVWRRSTY